jgi:hypothetical protein
LHIPLPRGIISPSLMPPISSPESHLLKFFLFLVCAFPLLASAQAPLSIPTQQCVYHDGDDPDGSKNWSSPSLDQSAWRPLNQRQPSFTEPRYWIRCRADLASLRTVSQTAIQIRLGSAYELYLDGARIGAAGNIDSGDYSLNVIRSFPISPAQLPPGRSLLALRVTSRPLLTNAAIIRRLVAKPLQINAGDFDLLDAPRARQILSAASGSASNAIIFGLIGALAFPLLGLYVFDRSRSELLLLAIAIFSLAMLRINELALAASASYSLSACLSIIFLGNFLLIFAETPFVYAIAGRRMPLPVLALLGLTVVTIAPTAFSAIGGAHVPDQLGLAYESLFRPAGIFVHIAISLLPFFAFRPYASIAPRMRPLALFCMLWGFVDFIWFAVEATALHFPGIPNIFAVWSGPLLTARGIVTAFVLITLLALLFRDQRQITRERALLAAELEAAREVQQVLVPAENPSIPGFVLESVYRPANEVGGDFFQILPTPSGGVLAVIGDVSGKGMPAAMTVSLLIGTFRTLAHYTQSPSEILASMNQRMLARSNGGFTTCLVARIRPSGQLTVANAGHIPPYLAGRELALNNGLPLGISADVTYSESVFALTASQQLTLLTDGVPEAQNKQRKLLGFDRTIALSTQPAESIANAAQHFGQNDDITVLTIALLPASG